MTAPYTQCLSDLTARPYDGDAESTTDYLEARIDIMSARQTVLESRQINPADSANQHLWGVLLPTGIKNFPWYITQRKPTMIQCKSKFHCYITGLDASDIVTINHASKNGVWIENHSLVQGEIGNLQDGTTIHLTRPENNISFVYHHFGGIGWRSRTPTFDDKYKLGDLLGSGTFGSVQKAVGVSDGVTYAVKVHESLCSWFECDVTVCREMDGDMTDATALYIVLEFVHGASELLSWYLSHNMCSETQYLHEQGIVHRDLKPENVLVSNGPVISAKIADFGPAIQQRSEILNNAFNIQEHIMNCEIVWEELKLCSDNAVKFCKLLLLNDPSVHMSMQDLWVVFAYRRVGDTDLQDEATVENELILEDEVVIENELMLQDEATVDNERMVDDEAN
ncbi:kinase-like domain-containing protein [Auriculariales sp. MPI-PUGE-AT-0066]|nr:kinase-like domain-containing protein [Auriculariales sp. MPI-PUGE-AT-0066]